MAEKFTFDLISKSHKKFENIKIIPIKVEVDGEIKETELGIYKIFSPTKISECTKDFIKNIDKARKIDRDGFGDITEPYLMWLIIKHFSEMEDAMPNDFNKQVNSLMEMVNTGVLFQIMVHFDNEQIELIKESLEIALATFNENEPHMLELKEKIKKELKDKTLLD